MQSIRINRRVAGSGPLRDDAASGGPGEPPGGPGELPGGPGDSHPARRENHQGVRENPQGIRENTQGVREIRRLRSEVCKGLYILQDWQLLLECHPYARNL